MYLQPLCPLFNQEIWTLICNSLAEQILLNSKHVFFLKLLYIKLCSGSLSEERTKTISGHAKKKEDLEREGMLRSAYTSDTAHLQCDPRAGWDTKVAQRTLQYPTSPSPEIDLQLMPHQTPLKWGSDALYANRMWREQETFCSGWGYSSWL